MPDIVWVVLILGVAIICAAYSYRDIMGRNK